MSKCAQVWTLMPGIMTVNYLKMANYSVDYNYDACAKHLVFNMVKTFKTNCLKAGNSCIIVIIFLL